MAKVTSKYQVTLPKAIADRFHIRPGDNIDWVAAGEAIRVIPSGKREARDDRESRLRLFDQAMERQARRGAQPVPALQAPDGQAGERGWTREDLYERGSSR